MRKTRVKIFLTDVLENEMEFIRQEGISTFMTGSELHGNQLYITVLRNSALR